MRWLMSLLLLCTPAFAQTYTPPSLAVSTRDRPWDAYGWMPSSSLPGPLALELPLMVVPSFALSLAFERQRWLNWLQPTPRREPVGVRRDPVTGAPTLVLVPSSYDLRVYANQTSQDRAVAESLQRVNEKMTNALLPAAAVAVAAAVISTIVETTKAHK